MQKIIAISTCFLQKINISSNKPSKTIQKFRCTLTNLNTADEVTRIDGRIKFTVFSTLILCFLSYLQRFFVSSPNSLVGMCYSLLSFIPLLNFFSDVMLRCLLTTAHAWAGTGTSAASTGPSGPRTWSGQLRFIRVLYVPEYLTSTITSPNFWSQGRIDLRVINSPTFRSPY
jgi:hypothetical protein